LPYLSDAGIGFKNFALSNLSKIPTPPTITTKKADKVNFPGKKQKVLLLVQEKQQIFKI
jgi:hypothetical protein